MTEKEDAYKPIADALDEQRKRIIEDFIGKLDIDEIDILMNAIANLFGVEEIIDWLKKTIPEELSGNKSADL